MQSHRYQVSVFDLVGRAAEDGALGRSVASLADSLSVESHELHFDRMNGSKELGGRTTLLRLGETDAEHSRPTILIEASCFYEASSSKCAAFQTTGGWMEDFCVTFTLDDPECQEDEVQCTVSGSRSLHSELHDVEWKPAGGLSHETLRKMASVVGMKAKPAQLVQLLVLATRAECTEMRSQAWSHLLDDGDNNCAHTYGFTNSIVQTLVGENVGNKRKQQIRGNAKKQKQRL